MGKNLTSIPGTSGPSHPLQSTIQPILGVLEQFWPKNLAEQANPTASLVGSKIPHTTQDYSSESVAADQEAEGGTLAVLAAVVGPRASGFGGSAEACEDAGVQGPVP